MFQPHTIKLVSGLAQNIEDSSSGNPELLENASNCIITKKGSLRSRPGLVEKNHSVQSTDVSGAVAADPASSIGVVTAGLTRAGLEVFNNQLLVLYQGIAYAKTKDVTQVYRDIGRFWSVTKRSTPTLDYQDNSPYSGFVSIPFYNPVAVGTNLVNSVVTSHGSVSLPLINNNTLEVFDTQSLSNFDAVSRFNACIATDGTKDVILYPHTDGSLRYHVTNRGGDLGSSTEVLLHAAGTVSVSTTFGQACWLVRGVTTDEYFYALKSSTAGRITVGRFIVGAGATATLNLNGLGVIDHGVALCHNGGTTGSGGALCVGFSDSTAINYRTKIITVTSTTVLTDAALDVTHSTTTPGLIAGVYCPHTVGRHGTSIIVNFVQRSGLLNEMRMDVRNFVNTTRFLAITMFGNAVGTSQDISAKYYFPFIPCTTFSSAAAIGIFSMTRVYNNITFGQVDRDAAQWVILDITKAITAANNGPANIIAAGPVDFQRFTPPVNSVVSTTNSTTLNYKFGVIDGIAFDISGAQSFGSTVKLLTTTPSRMTIANNLALFSGCTPYWYDGVQMSPVNFVEGPPCINSITSVAGGAGTASSSYTFQAIWEINNNKGQIIRSTQSDIVTASTTVGNLQFTITVSVPQIISRYLTTLSNVRVKLYSTLPSASAGAPLYLIATAAAPIANGVVTAGTVTFSALATVASIPNTAMEQLYTGGNVFDDQTPNSADRGIIYANNRIWAADSHRLYASKLLTTNYAPAWNNNDKLLVEMPTSIGEIRALGNLSDKLLVIGADGLAVVYGPGFDDLGNGPGWNTDITSNNKFSLSASAGPRSAVNIPDAVVYMGSDDELWLVDLNGRARCISRPTQDSGTEESPVEVCYVHPASSLIISNGVEHGAWIILDGITHKVLDVDTGQWTTWATNDITGVSTLFASLNGELYAQPSPLDADATIIVFNNWVSAVDTTTGLGTTDIIQTIKTGAISVAGPENPITSQTGRLRSITIVTSKPYTSNCDVTVNVTADNSGTSLLSKTRTFTGTSAATWPYIDTPEFRTTKQRCASFKIQITVVPAKLEISAIDFWSYTTSDKYASKNRG